MRRAYNCKGGKGSSQKKKEILNNGHEIARFLREFRNIKKKSCSRLEVIKCENYEAILQANRHIAGFENETQKFITPELAKKLGIHFKSTASIVKSMALERGDDILLQGNENFIKLHEIRFLVEIGASATRTTEERRRNAPKLLPLSRDVVKLSN